MKEKLLLAQNNLQGAVPVAESRLVLKRERHTHSYVHSTFDRSFGEIR